MVLFDKGSVIKIQLPDEIKLRKLKYYPQLTQFFEVACDNDYAIYYSMPYQYVSRISQGLSHIQKLRPIATLKVATSLRLIPRESTIYSRIFMVCLC